METLSWTWVMAAALLRVPALTLEMVCSADVLVTCIPIVVVSGLTDRAGLGLGLIDSNGENLDNASSVGDLGTGDLLGDALGDGARGDGLDDTTNNGNIGDLAGLDSGFNLAGLGLDLDSRSSHGSRGQGDDGEEAELHFEGY